MRLLDDMAPAPSAPIEAIAAAPLVDAPLIDADIMAPNIDLLPSAPNNYMPPQPLIEAPLDPLGAYIHGEDLGNYMAIQDAASHAVIDGPASAQCSC
jgi:hypothetical protein